MRKTAIFLIILVSLILLHYTQLSKRRSNEFDQANLEHSQKVWVKHWVDDNSCVVWVYEVRVELPECDIWRAQDELHITGSIEKGTATPIEGQKILIKQVKYTLEKKYGSLIDWPINTLNSASLLLFQRRAQIFSRLGSPEGELAQALIFGQSSTSLPKSLKEEFQKAGLQHLLSNSSYSFSVTIEFFLSLQKMFFQRKRTFEKLFFIGIAIFVVIIGAPIALVRVVVALLIDQLSTRIFYRPILPLYRLLLSTTTILLVNPYCFLDVGLQFSVLASVGIYLFAGVPKLLLKLASFLPKKIGFDIVKSIWISFAAQIFLWPLILFYFGEISIIGPLSNAALLWFLPTFLLLTFSYWVLGLISLQLTSFLLPFLYIYIFLFKISLHILAACSKTFAVQFSLTQTIMSLLFTVFIAVFVLTLKNRQKKKSRVLY